MYDDIEEVSGSTCTLKIVSMNVTREGGCHFKLAALEEALVIMGAVLTFKTVIQVHYQEKKQSHSDTNKLNKNQSVMEYIYNTTCTKK